MAGKFERDPVSVLFDAGARRLLARAYSNRGQWVGTRLANPTASQLAHFTALGIDPYGKDNPSAQGGTGLNARTRWARGFVRSLEYQHKWYSGAPGGGWREQRRTVARPTGALEIEIGRALPGGKQAGTVLVPGRAVRIRMRRGGSVARRAVEKMPESRRIYTDDGRAAARWSDQRLRDW